MRNLFIDWLRGASILIVMMTHFIISKQLLFFLPDWLSQRVGGNGGYGVTIFFTVSGFLITSRSLKRWGYLKDISLVEFYLMRAARILPLLLLFLAIMACLYYAEVPRFVPSHPGMFHRAIAAALTFQYQTFFMHGGNSEGLFAMAILWSLSIEELFYLMFPLVMKGLRRPSWAVALLIVLIIQAPWSRIGISFFSFFGSVDALSFGCLVAILVRKLEQKETDNIPGRSLMFVGTCLIAGVMGYKLLGDFTFIGPTLVAIGAAVFLIGAATAKPARIWSFPKFGGIVISPSMALFPFAMFGALSYELYLFHISYMMLLPGWFIPEPILHSIVNLIIVAVAATALNVGFSEPMNRMIRRLSFGRRKTERSAPVELATNPAG